MIDNKTLGLLWEKSVIGLALLDKNGYFLDVNSRLCEILEYSDVELVGKHFKDITLPSDQKPDLEMARRLASGELDYYKMTKTYLKKSGYPVMMDIMVYGLTNSKGEFEFFLSQMTPRFNLKPTSNIDEFRIEPTVLIFNWLQSNKKFMLVVLTTITAMMAGFTALFEFLKDRV